MNCSDLTRHTDLRENLKGKITVQEREKIPL